MDTNRELQWYDACSSLATTGVFVSSFLNLDSGLDLAHNLLTNAAPLRVLLKGTCHRST